MKCIHKKCGLFLISYSDNFTLVGVKRHQPLTFPGFKLGKVWRALQSDWFVMVRYIIVSSAKSLMLLPIMSGMSLMYKRNRHGPSTEL